MAIINEMREMRKKLKSHKSMPKLTVNVDESKDKEKFKFTRSYSLSKEEIDSNNKEFEANRESLPRLFLSSILKFHPVTNLM